MSELPPGALQKAVDHATNGATVRVPVGTERLVVRFGSGVILRGDAAPVVEGLSQTVVAGAALLDEGTFGATTGSSAHGSDSGETSQSLVVSRLQSRMAFCEHHGAVVNPDAWQR